MPTSSADTTAAQIGKVKSYMQHILFSQQISLLSVYLLHQAIHVGVCHGLNVGVRLQNQKVMSEIRVIKEKQGERLISLTTASNLVT